MADGKGKRNYCIASIIVPYFTISVYTAVHVIIIFQRHSCSFAFFFYLLAFPRQDALWQKRRTIPMYMSEGRCVCAFVAGNSLIFQSSFS